MRMVFGGRKTRKRKRYLNAIGMISELFKQPEDHLINNPTITLWDYIILGATKASSLSSLPH